MTVDSLWIGGYTAELGGAARGIVTAALDRDGTLAELRLGAPAANPSFVAQHPHLPVLYAVGEHDGTVRAFAIASDGALTPLGEPVPAGAVACHVAIDPDGRFAAVACWGSGQVVIYALDAASGAIGERADTAPAIDPYSSDLPLPSASSSQSSQSPRVSRAHYSHFLADGRLLTTDLGFDLVRVWRYSTAERAFELDHEVVFPCGAGPRHAAVGPDGRIYVVCEDAVAVYALEADATGRYAMVDWSPLRTAPPVPGDYAAHISLSADGGLIYATVRGSDVVAVLRTAPTGALAPFAEVPSGGDWPRHHLVTRDRLYVANQRSNELTVFALGADGVPGEVVQRCTTGSPTAIVPALLTS